MGSETVTPDHILQIGFAFRASKALLSAVELGIFTVLGDGPLDRDALIERLGLHGRGARDFFDALVALGLLNRDAAGDYYNTPDGAVYLDARKPTYLGGQFEYLNARMYPTWGLLTPALRSGAPQSGPSGGFAGFYTDKQNADMFLKGMTGGSLLAAQALAANFPWGDYAAFIDIGTAQGGLPVEIARVQTHLKGGGFDLPSLAAEFANYVRERNLDQRLKFYPGDFFCDPLPQADVLIMGRILHDWDIPTRKLLLQKAYAALPEGGALIVYDTLIDDARRNRPQCLLSSLNMLIQTKGGSEYTGEECICWMRETGFAQTRTVVLTGMQTAVIGIKGGT